MTEREPGPGTLMQGLCPWLAPAYSKLIAAHAGKRLGHGWILLGPDGVGKVNLALAVANVLLNEAPKSERPAALGPKLASAAIAKLGPSADFHPDLHWIALPEDKKRIGVEQIREMSERLALTSFAGGSKVAVIRTAEAMTSEAANALLKTLEEPTGDTYIFLLTQRSSALPATIRSRCQEVVLERPSVAETGRWLAMDGLDTSGLTQLEMHMAMTPFGLVEAIENDYLDEFNQFAECIDAVYEGKLDAQAAAETLSRRNPERALNWLIRRLQLTIRARSASSRSNSVTVSGAGHLHNLWEGITLRTLFRQLERAERLQYQAGRGINEDLALRALLLGFGRNRGQA